MEVGAEVVEAKEEDEEEEEKKEKEKEDNKIGVAEKSFHYWQLCRFVTAILGLSKGVNCEVPEVRDTTWLIYSARWFITWGSISYNIG